MTTCSTTFCGYRKLDHGFCCPFQAVPIYSMTLLALTAPTPHRVGFPAAIFARKKRGLSKERSFKKDESPFSLTHCFVLKLR